MVSKRTVTSSKLAVFSPFFFCAAALLKWTRADGNNSRAKDGLWASVWLIACGFKM
jgi:hypothetical protein